MKAMILAAGYGTRLKPLTDKTPKALIKINQTPLLELVIKKLIAADVSEIIINIHHHAEQIISFIKEKRNFGIRIEFSKEAEILGTGGGLKQAAHFFDDGKPFFLHNVDILSTINLPDMYQYHLERNSLVTLALKKRETKRFFIIDDKNFICGHADISKKVTRIKRTPQGKTDLMPFCGIHVISPKIFDYLKQTGQFSIVDVYLDLIANGLPVIGYLADKNYWKDIGKLDTLKEVQEEIEKGKIWIEDLVE
ncbi:nucleotidyltransferase family protein [candidate division KSB1 bacterium]|nr:nucleotidyltransferase family protein [candidate division KSB1 bacterium]MBL7095603.1 nucleotidyltransferase family protein [candidate division KSB1 bacterium]